MQPAYHSILHSSFRPPDCMPWSSSTSRSSGRTGRPRQLPLRSLANSIPQSSSIPRLIVTPRLLTCTWCRRGDHKDPNEFRASAKKDILARYSTVQFADVAVMNIRKERDSHFTVRDASGKEWHVHKVVLAVGSSDRYPEIEGYDQLWTKRM